MSRLMLMMLVFILIPMHVAYSFSGSRCARLFDAPSYMGKKEQGFLKLFYASTSTSQFFTSTGKCKMLGGVSKNERKYFISHNSEHIKKNIIRAEGDYLSVITYLYGCRLESFEGAALRLQEGTSKIFGPNLDYGAIRVSNELDSFMTSDAKIRQICSNSNV